MMGRLQGKGMKVPFQRENHELFLEEGFFHTDKQVDTTPEKREKHSADVKLKLQNGLNLMLAFITRKAEQRR